MLDGEDEKSVTRPPLRTNEEKLAFVRKVAEIFGLARAGEPAHLTGENTSS